MTPGATETGGAALARLRGAMRPHHERIERVVDLMQPGLTPSAYQRFLERSYGFINACERALDHDRAPAPLQLRQRLKTPLLFADLQALGLTASQIAALPEPSELPPIASWPDALGYCYVLEGSTLGGQVLSRHLSSTLAVPSGALTFLRSYEREVGPMWKTMLAVLEAALAEERAEQPITESARSTFDLLARWHAS